MSDKRYLGNIITDTPTAPAGPYENDAASGVWSLAEAFAYNKAGLWPIAGNLPPLALFGGGQTTNSADYTDRIELLNLVSAGNASDYGDLTAAKTGKGACASSTRAVWAGGSPSNINVIEFVPFASSGNAADFGDLTQGRRNLCGLSSDTRGIFAGGEN